MTPRTPFSQFSIGQALTFALGIALCAVTHLLWIDGLPGFHFDEAWAANFAKRIAFEPGFWPLTAMSPQTSPWGHYWSAIFFKILGPELWVFRLSCMVLGLSGITFLCATLCTLGRTQAATLLPWIAASSTALVLNHRFGIELTSVHACAFGGLLWSLACRKQNGVSFCNTAGLVAALFIGITSHVLFIAVALATFALEWNAQKKDSLRAWALLGLLLLPFSIRIAVLIPEKDKAAGLVLANGLLILVSAFSSKLPQISERHLSRALFWLSIGAFFLLFIFAFLFEGHWQILFQLGTINVPALIGSTLLPIVVVLFIQGPNAFRRDPIVRSCFVLFLLLILALALVAPKPTGRYYETAFLLFVGLMSLLLSGLRRPIQLSCTALMIATGLTTLGINYFVSGKYMRYQDRGFRFLIFHDSSRDFVPAQFVAQDLNALGCTRDQIETPDSRLSEVMDFLILAVSKHPSRCPPQGLRVQRGQFSEPALLVKPR